MARERDGDQAMGAVDPGGTGGRRPTGAPPGRQRVRPLAQGPTLDGTQDVRGSFAYLPAGTPGAAFPGVGVDLYRLEQWRDATLVGMEEGLKARNGDPLKGELYKAMKRLDEMTMENETATGVA